MSIEVRMHGELDRSNFIVDAFDHSVIGVQLAQMVLSLLDSLWAHILSSPFSEALQR